MEKNVKLLVTTSIPLEGKELERVVDADISAFDEYFKTLGNDSVVNVERAIIKTFLFWHLRVKERSAPSPSTEKKE